MSNYNWRQYGPPNVNNAQANGNGFFHTSRTNNNTVNNGRQNSSRYNINNNSINTSYRNTSNDTNPWGNNIGVRPGTGDTGQQKVVSGAINQPIRRRLDDGRHQNIRPQWSSNGGGGRRSSHYDNQNNVSLGGVRNGRGHGPPHSGRGRFDVYDDSNNGGRHGWSSNGHGRGGRGRGGRGGGRGRSPPVNFRHGNSGRGGRGIGGRGNQRSAHGRPPMNVHVDGRGGRGMGGRDGNNLQRNQRSAHGRPPIPMNVHVDGRGGNWAGRGGISNGGRGTGRGADGRTFDGTDISNTQPTTKSTKPKNKSEVFEDIGKVDFIEGKWFPDPTSRIAQFCISSHGGITPDKHKTRMISFNSTEVVGGVNINSTEVVGGVNIVKGDNVRVTYHKKHGSWKAIRVVRLPSAHEITFAAKLANPTPKVRSDSLVLRNADNHSAIPRKEFVNKRGHVSLAVQRARWREQQEEIRREAEEREREEEALVDLVNTMDSNSNKKVSGGGKVTSPKEALEKLEKFLNVDLEDEEAGVEGKASDTSVYGWKPTIKISVVGKDLRNELAEGAVVILVPKNIPEGEHEIFYSLLRSLAVQAGSKWTLKAEITDEIKRAEELQGALQDMWNAVCGVKGSTYEQARTFTYKLMTMLGVSREAKSTLMVDVVYDIYANGKAEYLGRQPTYPRRHEKFTGVESEEDRIERERFGALMRECPGLPSYPPAFVTLAHLSDVLRRGDVVPLILPHCNLSDAKWGISSNFGGLCNAGAPEGCIEANCTIQNLSIIAHGLPSSLDRGGIIPGAVAINTDSTCTTTIDEHCACQPTSEDRGRMVAWLINEFNVTCKRRKICLIVIPAFGTSCGALDTCWKQLDPELYKLAGKETTHPSNWSTEIEGFEPVGQSNWVGKVIDDWDYSVKAFITQFEKETGIKVTRPEMTMRECANASDRLYYVAEDAEALKVLLDKQRLSRDKRIKSRVMWFATMSSRLGGDTLVYTLRSVPLDCEKWLKSNTRKMLDEHQVDNFNELTIRNVLQTMGRKGGFADTEKQNAARKTNGENRMAKDGFNEREQSKVAISMGKIGSKIGGNAVVKSGNQHKLTQADCSKGGKQSSTSNNYENESALLSKERNKYISTDSTHWVMFRCLGYGDNETCPHGTVRYHGNNTGGASKYTSRGGQSRRARKCPCGPTLSAKGEELTSGSKYAHVEWEKVGTISDEEYMTRFGANANA